MNPSFALCAVHPLIIVRDDLSCSRCDANAKEDASDAAAREAVRAAGRLMEDHLVSRARAWVEDNSMRQLAHRSGVPRETLRAWLGEGGAGCKLSGAASIAAAIGLRLALLGGKDER